MEGGEKELARSRKSKSAHNNKVRELAREYLGKGYDVDADVTGFHQPQTIDGLRPDLRAHKDGHETVIEVETQDSKDSARDLKQQKAFKDWSKKSPKRHYKRIVTEE